MTVQHGDRRCIFTLDQANAMLPLVRAIVSDLVGLAHQVSDRWERLSCLLADREWLAPSDPYAEELVQVGEDLERDRRRLQEYVDELIDLGVEPKSAIEGLVDFPAMVQGRRVSLCWKLGEPEIRYWHEIDGEYEDRHTLATSTPPQHQPIGAA
ncbi:MAG: DUF2203 domain-containing protein [Pirellulales bacterium]|nr:DUF2203 domain-containing protein [Pirellulales bacterium]